MRLLPMLAVCLVSPVLLFAGDSDTTLSETLQEHALSLPLESNTKSIRASQGGQIDLYLDAGVANAHRTYLLLGTLSGTEPGHPLPGGIVTLPLNLDLYTEKIQTHLNTASFYNFAGTLDDSGKATAQFTARSIPPAFIGTMQFAYLLSDPFDFVSNPVAINVKTKPVRNMCLIPAGEFTMGDHHDHMPSSLPLHPVYVDAFYMDRYETTNELYCLYLNSAYSQGLIEVSQAGNVVKKGDVKKYCDTTGISEYSRVNWDGETFWITAGKEQHPVVYMSWYGSVAYANWLSEQDGLTPCYDLDNWSCNFEANGFRLPTEAEWEKAARGGQYAPYYRYAWGDSLEGSKGNYWESGDPFEDPEPLPYTTPIGYYNGNQSPPGDRMDNGYGLYDMTGGVMEWCNDKHDFQYYQYCVDHGIYHNPKGPPTGGQYRVLHGGAWFKNWVYLRLAHRYGYYAKKRFYFTGFRLVRKYSLLDQ